MKQDFFHPEADLGAEPQPLDPPNLSGLTGGEPTPAKCTDVVNRSRAGPALPAPDVGGTMGAIWAWGQGRGQARGN